MLDFTGLEPVIRDEQNLGCTAHGKFQTYLQRRNSEFGVRPVSQLIGKCC